MVYTLLFFTSFVYIFLKAFQQRNVAFDKYLWIMPTSYGLAVTEIYMIASVAREGLGFLIVMSVGTGAGLGALVATYIHRRMFK